MRLVGLPAATADAVCFPDCDASLDSGLLPHVVRQPVRGDVRDRLLGHLPGHLLEESGEPGSVRRFVLLRLVLPDSAAGPVALLSTLAVAVHATPRGDRWRPGGGAPLVTRSALLRTSPSYSWYALIVVALVALDGRWKWPAVPLAGLAVPTGNRTDLDPDTLRGVGCRNAPPVVIAGALTRGNRIGSTVDTSAETVPY